MANETNTVYTPPCITLVRVAVEKGFAVSANVNDWGDGGSLGDYDTE